VLTIVYASEKIVNPGFQLTLNGPFSMEVLMINSFTYSQSIDIHANKPTLLCTGFTFPHLSNGQYTLSFAITRMTENRQETLYSLYDCLTLSVETPDPKYKTGGQLVAPDARMITIKPSNHMNL
jgi:hypothetical protein